jgi:hypothetical protein
MDAASFFIRRSHFYFCYYALVLALAYIGDDQIDNNVVNLIWRMIGRTSRHWSDPLGATA